MWLHVLFRNGVEKSYELKELDEQNQQQLRELLGKAGDWTLHIPLVRSMLYLQSKAVSACVLEEE